MNIPDSLLTKAAGFAQQMAGTSKIEWLQAEGFGDDPRDTERIKQGIGIYNDWHKTPFDWLFNMFR